VRLSFQRSRNFPGKGTDISGLVLYRHNHGYGDGIRHEICSFASWDSGALYRGSPLQHRGAADIVPLDDRLETR